MNKWIKKMTISVVTLTMLGTVSTGVVNAATQFETSLLTHFKQQTTDDAKVATKKSISNLTQADLNNFIPTESQKVSGNTITDPGSDANFVTKINYKAETNPKNVIKLPAGYTNKRLKYLASKKAIKDTNAQIKMGKIGLQGLAINSFTPRKEDLKRNVDLNRITYAQRKELTQFTLQILNPAIKQANGIKYKTAQNVINAAQTTANVYSQDNWNNTGEKVGHDTRSQAVVSKQYSIKDVAEANYTDNPAFALTSPTIKKRIVSMAALKHAIYNSVALQLFEDGPSYWGHATALMNLDIHKQYQPNYLGTAFDKFGGLHFFMVPHSNKVNKSFQLGNKITF